MGLIAVGSVAARFIAGRCVAGGRRFVRPKDAGPNPRRRLGALLVIAALAGLCSPAVAQQWGQNGPAGRAPGAGPGPGAGRPVQQNRPPAGAPGRAGNAMPMNLAPNLPPQFARALTTGTNLAILNGVTPATIDSILGYRPDPQISAQTRANAIATASANNPSLRPTLEQAFANDAALKAYEGVVTAHGYSNRNVADAMATLLWVSWQLVNGVTATETQIRGIHQQMRAVFIGTPELRALPPGTRQQVTETIAYVVVMFAAATQSGDPKVLAEARQSTAATLKSTIGVDLAELEVTADSGFRQKRGVPALAAGPAASAGAATAAVQNPPQNNADLTECANSSNKEFNRRIDACTRVIAGNAGNNAVLLQAHMGRGTAYGELKQFDRMMADYDEMLRIDPRNLLVDVVRASGFIVKHEYDRAVVELDKVIASQPNLFIAEALAVRSHAYLRMANYDRALADINKSLSLKPDLGLARAARAFYHLEQDNNDGVLADATEAIRLESGNETFFLIRSEAYLRKGQIAEAQADADRALGINPRSGDAHNSRARIALKQGRIEVAIGEFSQAVELDEQLPNAFVNRGVAYERTGKADLALADYRRAVTLTPNDKMDRDAQATARQRIAALTAAAANTPAAAVPTAAATAAAVAVAAPPAGRRIALVIGMGAYVNVAPLRNPVSDARAVADAFRRLGFAEVIERLDLTRAKLEETLKDFGDKAADADWAVIYYAGHGVEMNGVNYLVPVDAKLARAEHVEDEAVTLTRVLSKADAARQLRMVILDACRNNPFRMAAAEGRTRSIGRGLSPVEPARGVLVAYAARDGTTADDGDSGHSPFTQALLAHIETPGVDIRIMFSKIRDMVLTNTRNVQEPFTYGSLPGQEFYFKNAAAR